MKTKRKSAAEILAARWVRALRQKKRAALAAKSPVACIAYNAQAEAIAGCLAELRLTLI